MGSAIGAWQMFEANKAAEEANNLTAASMASSAAETARAEVKADQAEKQALAGTAKKAENVDLTKIDNLNKKKKGVQSTFTATTGVGAGMMNGTSLTPIGGE